MTTIAPRKPSSTSEEPLNSSRDALASLRIQRPEAPPARRSRGKGLVGIVLLLLAGGGYFGYRYAQSSGTMLGSSGGTAWMPDIMQNRVEVRLSSVTVQQGRSADAVVVATGYLESRRQARIGARAAGRIDIITFEEGDKVKQGDVLAEMDHKDLDASLAASAASLERAKAALAEQEILIEQAKVDLDRNQQLWKSKNLAESDYDLSRFSYQSALARKQSLKTEVDLAEAQLRQAEQIKENMFIRAPFDGTVILKDAEVGESIMPGGMGGNSGRGSVATIADLESLQIECDVQEDFISRVSEGQEADIAVDAVQNKKYHGRVRKIIPMGDRARATIKVQVEITDADSLLFPEMAGTVYFLPTEKELEVNDQPRMFCTSSAVATDDQGNQFVWVVDDAKRAKKIAVSAGGDRDGRIEIVKGLSGKERVIVNPEGLKEGVPVTVAD